MVKGDEDIEIVVSLLGKKFGLTICNRDLSLCLTVNEIADSLLKNLEYTAPSLIFIKYL